MKRILQISVAVMGFALIAGAARAQAWHAMGPPGGDVRTLASDPSDARRIFLGTTDGHIFGSVDGGTHWSLLGRAGTRRDSVITAIVVDPRNAQNLWASAWTLDPQAGGAVYRSTDGGATWKTAGLDGHVVRALAESQSEPDELVAGAVDGVFRSRDAGKSWERISPEGDGELRNFDSIAIDPKDAGAIYAGTYHLPWATTDGGAHWKQIHAGMIDDSDVMSIVVDRADPKRVYASACSGIYLSEDRAADWRKIQGIPYSARRTQQIVQDPEAPATVYAATTEGLWRTNDAGGAWLRITPGDWVINSVAIVPRRDGEAARIVIGTERLGILASDDSGKKFTQSNEGFNHRQVVALALDPQQPGRVLAVVANGPEPLLATEDGGKTWEGLGPGLGAMRHIYASPAGWWATLERGGWMRYDAKKSAWVAAGKLTEDARAQLTAAAQEDADARQTGPHPHAAKRVAAVGVDAREAVNDLAFSTAAWYAATDRGLLRSTDNGATWGLQPLGPMPTLPVRAVRVSEDGRNLWVVSLRGLVFSHDAGKTWSWHDLPMDSGGALWLDIAPADPAEKPRPALSSQGAAVAAYVAAGETIVAGTERGLYVSRDSGNSWQAVGAGLPQAPLQDLAIEGNTFLASMRAGGLYLSRDRGENWERVNGMLAEGFFPVVTTEGAATTLFAASATEGLFAVQVAPAARTSAASTGSGTGTTLRNQQR